MCFAGVSSRWSTSITCITTTNVIPATSGPDKWKWTQMLLAESERTNYMHHEFLPLGHDTTACTAQLQSRCIFRISLYNTITISTININWYKSTSTISRCIYIRISMSSMITVSTINVDWYKSTTTISSCIYVRIILYNMTTISTMNVDSYKSTTIISRCIYVRISLYNTITIWIINVYWYKSRTIISRCIYIRINYNTITISPINFDWYKYTTTISTRYANINRVHSPSIINMPRCGALFSTLVLSILFSLVPPPSARRVLPEDSWWAHSHTLHCQNGLVHEEHWETKQGIDMFVVGDAACLVIR